MAKDPQSQPSSEQKSGKGHFIAGTVLLFIMAFVWSIDSSFIYLLLGAATFFFFLGFRVYFASRPIVKSFSSRVRESYRATPSQPQEEPSTLDEFSELLKQAQHRAHSAQASAGPSKDVRQKVVAITILFISGIFLVIILSVIFSSDNDSPSDDGEFQAAEQTNLQKADAFYNNEQYDSAYLYFRRAMRDEPAQPYPAWGYASALYMRGDIDSSIMMYNKALEIDPGYNTARFSKAWVYNAQKNYRLAHAEVLELIRVAPDYADAYALQGDIFFNQTDYTRALSSYEQAYAKNYRNNALCKTMADLYIQQGNNQKAIALYQEALTYDSTDGYSYTKLGALIQGEEGNFYRTKAAEYQQ